MVSEIVNLHILPFISQLKGTVWKIWEMFWVCKDSMSHVWRQRPLLCMLHCVQSIHNGTKTHVVKSLCVCNIVVHVLQIIVVWLQVIMCEFLFTLMRPDINQFLFVSADVYLVQNQTVTVQNGPNFRDIYIRLRNLLSCLMLCYRVYFVSICLSCVIECILCQFVLKDKPRVQAIINAWFQIVF